MNAPEFRQEFPMSASNVSGFMNIQIPSGNSQMAAIGRGADRDGDNETTGSVKTFA